MVSKIDQHADRREEYTARITPPGFFAVVKSLETPAWAPASAFAIRGKVTRKRPYVSSGPVPRIFVVDDEHVIAATLVTILHMNGFSARFFTDPVEALAAARLDAPDLLVSDVAMPGLSGVDLAIQIKAQYPECKILLFSGQAATLDLLKDARSQGYDFQVLQKPVHPSVMLSRIGALATENSLVSSRTSPRPVPALPIKAASRVIRMPRCTGSIMNEPLGPYVLEQ